MLEKLIRRRGVAKVFGLERDGRDDAFAEMLSDLSSSCCLFARDSGQERVLA